MYQFRTLHLCSLRQTILEGLHMITSIKLHTDEVLKLSLMMKKNHVVSNNARFSPKDLNLDITIISWRPFDHA